MGVVYEAIHEKIKRRVAIKLLHAQYASSPEALTRFFNEALAVNLIEHPGLVQVHEYGNLEDGSAYLVMEYLHGQTLAERLLRAKVLMPESEVLSLAVQLASALQSAHARGIVHRDLKPGNIMLVSDPAMPSGERVKLLDFGIAKLADGVAEANKSPTRTGAILGTPKYMAPEQCRGIGDIDGKVDVYSLGVLLYQLLCGRAPFEAGSQFELISKQLFEAPPPLDAQHPKISKPLVALVHRMLAKSREHRPAMDEVFNNLQRFRTEQLAPMGISGSAFGAAAATVALSPSSAIGQSKIAHQEAGHVVQSNQLQPTAESQPTTRQGRQSAPKVLRKPARRIELPIVAGVVPASPGLVPDTVVPDPSTLTLQARKRWLLGGSLLLALVGTATFMHHERITIERFLQKSLHSQKPLQDPAGPAKIQTTAIELVPMPTKAADRAIVPVTAVTKPVLKPRNLNLIPPLRSSTEGLEVIPETPLPGTPDDTAEFSKLKNKGYYLKQLGQHIAAYDAFQAAYSIKKEPWLLAECGKALHSVGEYEKAVIFYEKFFETAPDASVEERRKVTTLMNETKAALCRQQKERLASISSSSEEDSLIMDAVEKASGTCSQPNLYVSYGNHFKNEGRAKLAVSLYDKYIIFFPNADDIKAVRERRKSAQALVEGLNKKDLDKKHPVKGPDKNSPDESMDGLRNPFGP